VWLTPLTLEDWIQVLATTDRKILYRVQLPQDPSESRPPPPNSACSPTPIRRSLTRSPGVWAPPTVALTPVGERPFEYMPSELRGLWSEIMDTLTGSPKSK